MPPNRSIYSRCIGSDRPAAYQPPFQIRLKDLPEEEAKIEKLARKEASKAKKAREAILGAPWVVNTNFRFPVGTVAMYKADARFAFTLTEREILTLRHEHIVGPPKSYFALEDVKELSRKKLAAGVGKARSLQDQFHRDRMAFTKTDNSNVGRRKNFTKERSLYVVERILKPQSPQEAGASS